MLNSCSDEPAECSYFDLEQDAMSILIEYLPHFRDESTRAIPTALECSLVSRGWRDATALAVGHSLPSAPPPAARRLREVLDACRQPQASGAMGYDVCPIDGHHYDRLVRRAESCALALMNLVVDSTGSEKEQTCKGLEEQERLDLRQEGVDVTNKNALAKRTFACRFGLMLYVGLALRNPAFAWCSTQGGAGMRVLEGCVGRMALLDVLWA
ncbi:unnamed protein product [Discosporangium mesarthrocarpum]